MGMGMNHLTSVLRPTLGSAAQPWGLENWSDLGIRTTT